MPPDALIETPPITPPTPRGFAEGYHVDAGGFDEMAEPGGALRPHWRMLVSQLDDLGPEERQQRWALARRLIHDNGITHNVYGDERGLDRPWNLDFVPLLIAAAEWQTLTRGLQQRARLLDRLLADLYGPATTVAAGVLPQELVYANPAFLRPCHGVRVPRDTYLHLYGVDLVRGVGGRITVLSDRTQAPSGAGYALENRIVLSQALPAIYRQCNVRRLAPFFVALRQTLAGLAPSGRDNPRVVLLTPGPYNETYFEHAYLARYLGYTLVQGGDLTVRDGKVFLKTLSGLQRVDVILRRVDDDYCDPLELRAGSYLGVPGLLGAVRDNNVAVANALGSGALQGPCFLPFMPRLCRHLLGEELLLDSVTTWWCGDPDSLRYALGRLDTLVIKPAYPSRKADPVFGATLGAADLAALAARIAARPAAFVAQEPHVSATAPALDSDRLTSGPFVLRTYLAAGGDDGYTLLPGGLTRTTPAESNVAGLQKG
ncbi:MAG TPA: circularly permuted type 2 ATP-grasp protein, partial [Tepidisphaeraceae bacterium]